MTNNYYGVLGITESASAADIRTAYRRLIRRFHPDRNPSPNAATISAAINEAYSVLSDPQQRARYDSWLRSQTDPTNATRDPESAEEAYEEPAAPPPPPDIRCHRCHRRDSTLRRTLMHYVVSVLVMTYRRASAGVWCSRCRTIESFKWTTLTCLAGWWGFPWGPIYTIQTLWTNSLGGAQVKNDNAALLRIVAYLLMQDGNPREAKRALDESLKLQANEHAEAFAKAIQVGEPVSPPDYWRHASAIPAVMFALTVGVFAYQQSNAPRGYEAQYQAPARAVAPELPSTGAGSSQTVTPKPASSPARKRVNDLVDELSAIVERRAPVTGTHMDGTTKVTDHALDRSKFETGELYRISSAIHAELEHEPDDTDGFIASSYFNAALFAISVDVINRIEAGEPVREQLDAVVQLGNERAVKNWLGASRFTGVYQALVNQARQYPNGYRPGRSLSELERDLENGKQQVATLRGQIDAHDPGDVDGYNRLVDEHNAVLQGLRASARNYEFQAVASRKLDLAFNKCLDSAILLTRFNSVNLTSHASEIEELPEPLR